MYPRWVADYFGIPFKEHGRDRDGLDCWGLVRLVYMEQFGVDLPSLADGYEGTGTEYGGQLAAQITEESMRAWKPVSAPLLRDSDVIVLEVLNQPMHVGIVLCKGHMLHVERLGKRGVGYARPECYDSVHWKNRLHGFYRHEQLA